MIWGFLNSKQPTLPSTEAERRIEVECRLKVLTEQMGSVLSEIAGCNSNYQMDCRVRAKCMEALAKKGLAALRAFDVDTV